MILFQNIILGANVVDVKLYYILLLYTQLFDFILNLNYVWWL